MHICVSHSDCQWSGNEGLTTTQRKKLNMQEVGLFLHLILCLPRPTSLLFSIHISSFILSFTDFPLSSHFLISFFSSHFQSAIIFRGNMQGIGNTFWILSTAFGN